MHYREDEIALLVSRGDLALQDEHIRNCPVCRRRFLFLREMHEGFVRESMNPPDRRIASGLEPVEPAREIHLKLFTSAVELHDIEQGRTVVLLAAEDDLENGADANTTTVFVSEKERIIMRAVPDRQGTYRLFVLADDPGKRDCVLIAVVDADGERAVVATDHQGVAQLSSASPIPWKHTSVHLRLPIARFRPDGTCPSDSPDAAGNYSLVVQEKDDMVRLVLQGGGAREPGYVLLVDSDGSTDLLLLVGATVSVTPPRMARVATMSIFH